MDAGILPFRLEHGIRRINRSQAKELIKRHQPLIREFMGHLLEQQIDLKLVDQAVQDREGDLYFRWISPDKQLPKVLKLGEKEESLS